MAIGIEGSIELGVKVLVGHPDEFLKTYHIGRNEILGYPRCMKFGFYLI